MGSNKDDIKPINLKNEKEFANEFSKISLTLENPSEYLLLKLFRNIKYLFMQLQQQSFLIFEIHLCLICR